MASREYPYPPSKNSQLFHDNDGQPLSGCLTHLYYPSDRVSQAIPGDTDWDLIVDLGGPRSEPENSVDSVEQYRRGGDLPTDEDGHPCFILATHDVRYVPYEDKQGKLSAIPINKGTETNPPSMQALRSRGASQEAEGIVNRIDFTGPSTRPDLGYIETVYHFTKVTTLCERWKRRSGCPEAPPQLKLVGGTLQPELQTLLTTPTPTPTFVFRPKKEESKRIHDGSSKRTVACVYREEPPPSEGGRLVFVNWSAATKGNDRCTGYDLNVLTFVRMDKSLQDFLPKQGHYLCVMTDPPTILTHPTEEFDVLTTKGLYAAHQSTIKTMILFEEGGTEVGRKDFEGAEGRYVERWVEVIPDEEPQAAAD